jgi:molybdate transport system substrate-binding protein
MRIRPHPSLIVALVIAVLFGVPSAALSQIHVITSGGFSAAYRELLPEFERTTGIKVTTTSGASQGDGPNTIGAQLRRGVPADVVILSREGLTDLIGQGRIAPGTDVDLASTPLGMAVRAGAPKPNISTVDAVKQTLIHAKGIAFINSTTGIYLTTTLFPRLGIADVMAAKSAVTGVAAVVSGVAELTIQPVGELLHAPGVDFVGTFPAEIQYVSVFAAAVVASSKEMDVSKQLVAFLASERATTAIENSGMEPSRRK